MGEIGKENGRVAFSLLAAMAIMVIAGIEMSLYLVTITNAFDNILLVIIICIFSSVVGLPVWMISYLCLLTLCDLILKKANSPKS